MYRYVLKVSYKRQRKVNLTLDIADTSTLNQLAEMILNGFDFDQDHLYLFNMDGKKYGADSYYRIPEGRERSTKIKIQRLYLHLKKKFLFLYDFGAEWEFEIAVQKAYQSDAKLANRVLSVNGSLQQYPNIKNDMYLVVVKTISKTLKVNEILEKQSEECMKKYAEVLIPDYDKYVVSGGREQLISMLAETMQSQAERILLCFSYKLLYTFMTMTGLNTEITMDDMQDIQTLSSLGLCLIGEEKEYMDEIDTRILIPKSVADQYASWIDDSEMQEQVQRYRRAENTLISLVRRYGVAEISVLYERFQVSFGEKMEYKTFLSMVKGKLVLFGEYSFYQKEDGTLFVTFYTKDETEQILKERERKEEEYNDEIDYPVYSVKECQRMIRTNLYYDNEPYKKLLSNVIHKVGESDRKRICMIIEKYGALGKEYEHAKEEIEGILRENDLSVTNLREQLIEMAMDDMPKAALKGWTQKEYDSTQIEKIKEEQRIKDSGQKKSKGEQQQMEGQISLFKLK